jgi:hypothetical protein
VEVELIKWVSRIDTSNVNSTGQLTVFVYSCTCPDLQRIKTRHFSEARPNSYLVPNFVEIDLVLISSVSKK